MPPARDPLRSPLRCLLRDSYGMLLFVGLLCLLCVAIKFGAISTILMSCRWPVLALLAIAGLAVGGDVLSKPLSGAHWWLLGLIAFSGASCTWSIDPMYSLERLFSFVLLYIAIFIGAWAWLQRKQNIILGAEILYLLTLIVTAIAAFHLGGDEILDRTTRATGAMGKATGAGNFAAAAIPILLWKVRYSRGIKRLIAQTALLIQGYLLFFSGARGALLASCAGLLALLWFNYRPWRPLILCAMFVMTTFAAIGLVSVDMLPDYIVRKESLATATGRLDRADALLAAFAERPMQGFGFGAGRFVICYSAAALKAYIREDDMTRHAVTMRTAHERGVIVEIQPHNDHIERLVEIGLPGYLCFAGMWISLLLCVPKVAFAPSTPTSELGRCLAASMWFFLVDSILHSGMFAIGNGTTPLMWFYLVLLLAAASQVERSTQHTPGDRRAWIAATHSPSGSPGWPREVVIPGGRR